VTDHALRVGLTHLLEEMEPRCWVFRTHSGVSCHDLLGAEFANGTVWTEQMCCVLCRLRILLERTEIPAKPSVTEEARAAIQRSGFRTKDDLHRVMGGDAKAYQDPLVKAMLRELPDVEDPDHEEDTP
jgi:hypothetical protein